MYETTVDGIDFEFDFAQSLVGVAAPADYLEAATLKTAAREAEASEEGIVYDHIVNASGRETFFEAGGDVIANALTVVLQGSWLVDTALSSGYFIVSGGNVLQENQDPRIQIFADNPTVNTINNTTQFGTISRVSVGSGVTEADVTAIGAEVESRFPGGDIDASIGALDSGLTELLRLQGFDASNPTVLSTDAQGRVTQIDAGTGHIVDVTYGANAVTFQRQP